MTFTNTQTKLGQAITTNVSGDYAVRTIIEGDQTLDDLAVGGTLDVTGLTSLDGGLGADLDAKGKYILNDQTTTNMMSKGTVYRFDGVNDKVVSGTSTEFAYDGTTPFSLFAQFNTSDTTQDAPIVGLWQSASAAAADIISLDIVAGVLKFYVIEAWSGQFIRFTTTDSFADDKNHIAIATYDGSGSSSGLAVYVDGVLCVGSADANGSIATFTATNTFGVANNAKWGSATFFCGEIGRYGIFNLEATASEVKDLVSGNIPFKWQYGSQTTLVTNGTFASNVASWSADGTSPPTITWNAGEYADIASILLNNDRISQSITTVIGKTYRMTMVVTNFSAGTSVVNMRLGASNNIVPITANGIYELEYVAIAALTNAYPAFTTSSGTETTYSVDDVSVVAIGAVALYDQTSISETTWYDKANGNNGAVTGASVLNDAASIPSTFVWHQGAYNFTWETGSVNPTVIAAGGVAGVHPTTVNNTLGSPVILPNMLHGKTLVLDQITVYFNTISSGDDFDFSLERTDQDGTATVVASLTDIGNGGTGNASATILSAPITLSDFAHYIICDVNNTDLNTDVKLFDIKFEGHLA